MYIYKKLSGSINTDSLRYPAHTQTTRNLLHQNCSPSVFCEPKFHSLKKKKSQWWHYARNLLEYMRNNQNNLKEESARIPTHTWDQSMVPEKTWKMESLQSVGKITCGIEASEPALWEGLYDCIWYPRAAAQWQRLLLKPAPWFSEETVRSWGGGGWQGAPHQQKQGVVPTMRGGSPALPHLWMPGPERWTTPWLI